MTTSRIDAIVDTAAGATKFVVKGYAGLFGEEATQRYQEIGQDLGTAIGETLERFDLDSKAKDFLARFNRPEVTEE